jgi:hypothetical protein
MPTLPTGSLPLRASSLQAITRGWSAANENGIPRGFHRAVGSSKPYPRTKRTKGTCQAGGLIGLLWEVFTEFWRSSAGFRRGGRASRT